MDRMHEQRFAQRTWEGADNPDDTAIAMRVYTPEEAMDFLLVGDGLLTPLREHMCEGTSPRMRFSAEMRWKRQSDWHCYLPEHDPPRRGAGSRQSVPAVCVSRV
jgi:hypothetical protein